MDGVCRVNTTGTVVGREDSVGPDVLKNMSLECEDLQGSPWPPPWPQVAYTPPLPLETSAPHSHPRPPAPPEVPFPAHTSVVGIPAHSVASILCGLCPSRPLSRSAMPGVSLRPFPEFLAPLHEDARDQVWACAVLVEKAHAVCTVGVCSLHLHRASLPVVLITTQGAVEHVDASTAVFPPRAKLVQQLALGETPLLGL